MQVDEKTAQDRTVRAGKMDAETFSQVIANFSPPHETEKPVVISGKHTYASQLKVVLSHLSKATRPHASAVAPRVAGPPQRRGIVVR